MIHYGWSSRVVEWSSGVVEWSSGVVEWSSGAVEWSSRIVEWSSERAKLLLGKDLLCTDFGRIHETFCINFSISELPYK